MTAPRLILASGSSVRRRMLASAGVVFSVDPADIDEAPLEGESAFERGRRLARDKALAVSARAPGAIVLGCDQVGVTDDGRALDKCWDEGAATAQLMAMQGRAHTFLSAAALARDGALLWEGEARATVWFRAFDENTARAYVTLSEWRGSAGSYQLEGRGAQLVEALDGSESAVLGLPLLEVLGALRALAPGLSGLMP